MIDLSWQRVEVLHKKINGQGLGVAACRIISDINGQCGILKWCMDFKPLTPPKTDKEKTFDKFLDDNYNSTKEEFTKSQSDKDFIEGLELAFNCGWAAQPLTVKE